MPKRRKYPPFALRARLVQASRAVGLPLMFVYLVCVQEAIDSIVMVASRWSRISQPDEVTVARNLCDLFRRLMTTNECDDDELYFIGELSEEKPEILYYVWLSYVRALLIASVLYEHDARQEHITDLLSRAREVADLMYVELPRKIERLLRCGQRQQLIKEHTRLASRMGLNDPSAASEMLNGLLCQKPFRIFLPELRTHLGDVTMVPAPFVQLLGVS